MCCVSLFENNSRTEFAASVRIPYIKTNFKCHHWVQICFSQNAFTLSTRGAGNRHAVKREKCWWTGGNTPTLSKDTNTNTNINTPSKNIIHSNNYNNNTI